jgi:hypothetical protein
MGARQHLQVERKEKHQKAPCPATARRLAIGREATHAEMSRAALPLQTPSGRDREVLRR